MCEKDHVSCMRAKVNILKGRKGLGYKNTKCAQWAHSQLLALMGLSRDCCCPHGEWYWNWT